MSQAVEAYDDEDDFEFDEAPEPPRKRRKTASKPAAKPAAKPRPADDEDELLASIGQSDGDDDGDELLAEMDGSGAEAWVPEDDGDGLVGRVIKVGVVRSDYPDESGNRPSCPVVTLETKDGEQWRVIGYSSVLRRELMDAAPGVGDLCAVKFFGEKTMKKGPYRGKNYKHYGVVVRRK